MTRITAFTLALAAFGSSSAVSAQVMTNAANEAPAPTAVVTSQAQPYLYAAGQSDLFEITAALIALDKSQNPDIREYARAMVQQHTKTTNDALAAAKTAGVTAPPPVLDAKMRAMVDALLAANSATFDLTYLQQQVPSHEKALEVVTGYSRSGDVAPIRAAAATAVPIVTDHLQMARRMRDDMRNM